MTREQRSSLAIGVAVFIAGGVLLGLEIASSRVMAPFFGNSLYVWGSLIGIVLAGLSTGYWLGGIVADRYPTPRLLVALLGAAALLVLAIPFVDGWVLDRVVAWDPGPRLNPVIATILLFGLPSLVLGSVSPVAVRLKARSIEQLGRTAGRLFAISTAGSIAGTFLTSFWLIPELGTDQVLASAAVALVLAAAAVALVERLAIAFAVALALAGASVGAVVSLAPDKGGTVAASQLRNWSPVYRQQSLETAVRRDRGVAERLQDPPHQGLAVPPHRRRRRRRRAATSASTARFRAGCTSTTRTGRASSTPTISSCPSPTGRRRGGSSTSASAGARRPSGRGATSRACESMSSSSTRRSSTSPTSTSSCPATPGWPSRSRTAAATCPSHEGPWDVIVVDAFYSDSIPFHLATREFLELARSRLTPGGLVVTNIIGAVRGPDSRLFRSMLRTYRAVFPTVAVHPVVDAGGNRPRVGPQHHRRGRRGRRAVEAVPARPLARGAPPLSGRARPRRGDQRPRRCARSRPRTCRC